MGTAESQDGKQLQAVRVFKQHSIKEKGAMNCSKDYSKYSANGMAARVLAAFTLIVTMNSGFGYAVGEIPAGRCPFQPFLQGWKGACCVSVYAWRPTVRRVDLHHCI